jgi:dihydrofolate synthase / folylpolyglutamate synthase
MEPLNIYQNTLDYLYSKLPLFTRIGAAAYKKDLTNTIALCQALGNKQNNFKTIHIAGTNGKGSTSHMLAAILQEAGYKVGLYTSPHLYDFRERIKINGQPCKQQFVIDFTTQIKPLIESIEPSFFEVTVAMAFSYFAEENVDVAVIEVGLGGRLDSTNIITPELSIITNIGWDHMDILGNTLPKIAAEKAGIIKPNIPVVIGEYTDETKPVFEAKAQQENAPIIFATETFTTIETIVEPFGMAITLQNKHTKEVEKYTTDLGGIYQAHNIKTVVAAVQQLQQLGFGIQKQQVIKALPHVKKLTGLHGRWEVLQTNPLLIIDVAHNENGMVYIQQQLEHITYTKLHIVIGMVKDKAIDNTLALLPTNATYYFTKANIPRALPETDLQQIAATKNLYGNTFGSVHEAVVAAKQQAHSSDCILVCGSVFVVAEVSR